MTCPLCRQEATRACPAVGQDICPVCCGTKRLVEIACPPDLRLSGKRAPASRGGRQAAAGTRSRGADDGPWPRVRAAAAAVFPDADVHRALQAATASAGWSTPMSPRRPARWPPAFETASRGVLYEHRRRRSSREALRRELKTLLARGRPRRRVALRARSRGGAARHRARRASTRRRASALVRRTICPWSPACCTSVRPTTAAHRHHSPVGRQLSGMSADT